MCWASNALFLFTDSRQYVHEPHSYGSGHLSRSVRISAGEMVRLARGPSTPSQVFRTLWARYEDVRRNQVRHENVPLSIIFSMLLLPMLIPLSSRSFAWAELLLCTAMLFRRFDFELCGVERKRDVDVKRDCFLGLPSRDSQGIRVKVALRTT